ncbi:extracellular solute-binding protein [Aestuariirhabdus sp. Z084]|uniref:extracellular solute-binding protein n=1 Tax=Aestuariirhabdus haliotis TaxID=2918751 RepID=UPI00201B4561|nr:extracellular solute-binding protein [Aestuariirhabdus haliotis]MCL6414573.1 extracellular solute-binding protein [Aestuariirhabdus haliotis]MCL6418445.1 extracellular solute-binding protein [Aestuariirhabdus haliotis]
MSLFKTLVITLSLLLLPICGFLQASSIKSHALSLYDAPKYPADFEHFDYVNPHAPKGGSVRYMATGTFDTLNPYTLKGQSPVNSPGFILYSVSESNETLMMGTDALNRSGDEPLTAYGLIAGSIEYPEDFSWVKFHLRPEARFHDGTPIQASDVQFSFETLIDQGHPRFRTRYRNVTNVEVTDTLSVKFSLRGDSRRRLAISLGELPVMSQDFWRNRDFSATTLTPPMGSGPYKISNVNPGRSITFDRVQDYWGKDLAVNQGRHNFDQVRFDFYRDLTVAFEAFKAQQYDVHLEYISKNWATGYRFAESKPGELIKREIPHGNPANLQGFVFNTRNALFSEPKVREALTLMFDFEWINRSLFHNAYKRSNSYFANSPLAATGLPTPEEQTALAQFDGLDPRILTEQYKLPITQGDGNQRAEMRRALTLLRQAGWELDKGILRNTSTKTPFRFEALIRQQSLSRVMVPFQQSLKKIGIQLDLRLIDSAQYKNRMDNFDFDMTTIALGQSLTPGNELRQYFHSANANLNGGLNYAGIVNPAVDTLISQVISASTNNEAIFSARMLDRVLLWQFYMVPNWYIDYHRVAYWNRFGYPESTSAYDLGLSTWWIEP